MHQNQPLVQCIAYVEGGQVFAKKSLAEKKTGKSHEGNKS